MYLRPVVHARLTATYCSCLRSINTCTMKSYHMLHILATTAGLNTCSLELNVSINTRPGLLQPTFCRSNNVNVNVGMDFDDLSEGL